MTTVTYFDSKDEISIEVEGHCGYDVEGEDIVCSAISMLAQTLLAYLKVDTETMKYSLRSGYVWMWAKGNDVQQALNVIMCGYYLLSESYPEHIRLVRGCSIQRNSA